MIKLQYYTLTVIQFRASILYVSPANSVHLLRSLLVFRCSSLSPHLFTQSAFSEGSLNARPCPSVSFRGDS